MFISLIFWVLTSTVPQLQYMFTPTAASIRKIQPNETVISDQDVSRIAHYIDNAADESGLDPDLLVVMTYGESRFTPEIVNIMQISQTWYANPKAPSYCKLARRSQEASIRCGAFVLSECSKKFKKDKGLYLCWRGFHIKDKEGYLERVRERWDLIKS